MRYRSDAMVFPSLRAYIFVALSLCVSNCMSTPAQAKDTLTEQPSQVKSLAEPITIDREQYADRLHGFWLGQSIGNWTGLVTEMDKIGGEGAPGEFYTREDWRGPDQPAIWSDSPSDLSPTIDFVLRGPDEVWGADDDTDIEYIYQSALHAHKTSMLTPEQIRSAWIAHIYDETEPTPYGPDEDRFQNYLWVSNQRAHELMLAGMAPPETSDPKNNPHWDMIDAQLTTEIFGLYAPGRPDIALQMAHLPIRTSARGDAALAAEFYVILHALAPTAPDDRPLKESLQSMASAARTHLPKGSYTAAMYDFVREQYESGVPWETARDRLYKRYQVQQADGYDVTSRDLYCNGCFASGINFGASLISLFYGEGDIKETIKIAALCGWDSDNPAATWGGLLGFMIGKGGIEEAFEQGFSSRFNIHRTRKGFPNDGLDDFDSMSRVGIEITDRAVTELIDGRVSETTWIIPALSPGEE
ncbi:MAG: ADP-ribosylglycohydrolase family protein [Henriciella sp.]